MFPLNIHLVVVLPLPPFLRLDLALFQCLCSLLTTCACLFYFLYQSFEHICKVTKLLVFKVNLFFLLPLTLSPARPLSFPHDSPSSTPVCVYLSILNDKSRGKEDYTCELFFICGNWPKSQELTPQ